MFLGAFEKKAFRYVTHKVQENNRQVSEIQKPDNELKSQSSADKFQLNKFSF